MYGGKAILPQRPPVLGRIARFGRECPTPDTLVQFELTTDYSLIESILTEPELYRRMANDSAPPREEFRAAEGNYSAILCKSEEKLIGLFILVPIAVDPSQATGGVSGWQAEVHFCFLPQAWRRAIQAGRAFVEWVWRETAYQTLIGLCPSYNPAALRMAKACGFREASTETAMELRDGHPFDLLVTILKRRTASQSDRRR